MAALRISHKLWIALFVFLVDRLWHGNNIYDFVATTTMTSAAQQERQTQTQQQEPQQQLVVEDTRPVSPNGYFCVFGAKGRLNNWIIQNVVGLYMAHHLNRTFLVDPEVSTYYNVHELSLQAFDQKSSPYLPAMAMSAANNQTSCPDPKDVSPYTIDKQYNVLGRIQNYHEQTRHVQPVTSVHNNDVWYWLGRPPSDFHNNFFRGLQLQPSLQGQIQDFVDKYLRGKRQYHALHLRWLEGACNTMADDKTLCCPTRDYVMDIIRSRGGDTSWPLFVASDGQCDAKILEQYSSDIMGYQGAPCQGIACAVLDFEVCVHADIFVGNTASTGDLNIREWRTGRYGRQAGLNSVVSRSKRVMELEAAANPDEALPSLSRHMIPHGYWKWWPDCDSLTAKQRRGRPCA